MKTKMAISSDEATAVESVRFVQKAIFHDALREPKTTDPEEILKLGFGRCGETSIVLSSRLNKSGIENRIVKLLKHIVVEAKWDGGWHLLDADLFKHGVIPKDDLGRIPALRDVQGSCFMDRFPATAYVYTRDYALYKDMKAELLPPRFYEAHEAGFVSYYYQMNRCLPLKHPPSRPTGLTSRVTGRSVALRWAEASDIDNDLMGYEVMIGTQSRGWDYDDPNYENVPCDTSNTPIFAEEESFETQLDPGTYFWSVRAVDAHRKKEPRTYYFPSRELNFTVR